MKAWVRALEVKAREAKACFTQFYAKLRQQVSPPPPPTPKSSLSNMLLGEFLPYI